MNQPFIRSIIGEIVCCLTDKIELIIKNVWHVKADVKLHINLTFIYLDVGQFRPICHWKISTFQPKEYVSVFYFAQRKRTGGERLEEIHQKFQGARHVFTIYSLKNKLHMESSIFYSTKVKFHIIFTVIDSSLLSTFIYQEDTWQKYGKYLYCGEGFVSGMEKHRTEKMKLSCYMWYIKFSESIQIKAYHVVITKLHKVKLILSNFNQSIIKIYYGLDTNSDLLKFRGNMAMLSAFPCFLAIQVQSFKVSAIGIDINSEERRSENNKDIEVTNLQKINLNICEKGNVLFCLIYLTTKIMYLNISLVNMTFNVPAFKDCAFWGITYFQDMVSNNHSDSYKEMKTMCENSTQESASFNKIPMDFVSAE